MRRRYVAVLFFVLSIFSTHANGQVTAIRAGRLIDPASGTASLNQIILVEKDKITAIGAEVAIPAGATVIDLSRSTILPGLFDMHTHLCLGVQAVRDVGNYYYTTLNDPDAFRAIRYRSMGGSRHLAKDHPPGDDHKRRQASRRRQ